MIKLDGSDGEGGGQILRTALALSIMTGKPFEMVNIRKNRPEPGLKNQHLHTINLYKLLYDIKIEDAHLGSDRILFIPGKQKKAKAEIDIGTAGSITLMLQSIMLPCIFGEKNISLKIRGGTDVRWSMPIDYFTNVVIPQMGRLAEIELTLVQRGYYPAGQGQVEIRIKPRGKTIEKITLTEIGKLMHVRGISHASNDLAEKETAERQAAAAKNILSKLGCDVRIDSRYFNTVSSGSGITLWATFSLDERDIALLSPIRIGADMLGDKTANPDSIGEGCAKALLEKIGCIAPVDSNLADNMVPILAIAKGQMKVEKITGHTRSNIDVCEKFLEVSFKIDEENRIISVD